MAWRLSSYLIRTQFCRSIHRHEASDQDAGLAVSGSIVYHIDLDDVQPCYSTTD